MSFTYNGAIATSDTDWIRFMIGDTTEQYAYLSDEEIDSLVTLYGTKELAARKAMEGILSVMAEKVSHTIGATKVDYGKLYDNYKKRYNAYVEELISNAYGGITPQEGEGCFYIGMDDWR
jgi:hypothetical protein